MLPLVCQSIHSSDPYHILRTSFGILVLNLEGYSRNIVGNIYYLRSGGEGWRLW